ncbi:hypothetical protein C1I95_33745 [Micromonospora craterilacus]|uniref:Uncharacterized protein n=1 Tax=Micromonospora craterilacus TaxID=1655439 RepID=A0A2W2CVM2_9ACTN|nr:hypothetical protein [Micromonospora craterilacus]PZG03586.1 hypothetical protein C1I95_33745 [Micromonospora craterilacus]
MNNGTHNSRCETAQQHFCRCTGCGGSQHGVQGWLDHVGRDDTARQRKREDLEGKLAWTDDHPPRLKPTVRNQKATIDLARVDIADWLAARPIPASPDPDDPYPSPVEQVTALAEEMGRRAWHEIAADLHRATSDTAAVKRELTNHGWCDLFIGLVQTIETTRCAFDSIPGTVKRMIRLSTWQAERPHVTETVIDLIVDKAWQAFRTAAFSGVPLLDILSSDEALRALRVLAVFICPAPAQHPAVRQHALRPLGDDATKILNDRTKAKLTELFADWQADDSDRQPIE